MSVTTVKQPTPEAIAVCAYLIWEKEGRPVGRDAAHWLQAESQLLADHCHEQAVAEKLAKARSRRRPPAPPVPVQMLQEVGT